MRGLPGLKPVRFGVLFPRAEARGFYRLLAARGRDEVLCVGCGEMGWDESAVSRLRGDGMKCRVLATRGWDWGAVCWLVDDPEPQRVVVAGSRLRFCDGRHFFPDVALAS